MWSVWARGFDIQISNFYLVSCILHLFFLLQSSAFCTLAVCFGTAVLR